jgi:hypothetical protein
MEHDDGDGEGEGEDVRVDHRGGAAFSLDRLDRDADRQRTKNAGLGQRRHRLYLGVAERVIGVGGLVGGKRGQVSRRRAEAPFVDTIFRPTGNNLRSGRVSFSSGT